MEGEDTHLAVETSKAEINCGVFMQICHLRFAQSRHLVADKGTSQISNP